MNKQINLVDVKVTKVAVSSDTPWFEVPKEFDSERFSVEVFADQKFPSPVTFETIRYQPHKLAVRYPDGTWEKMELWFADEDAKRWPEILAEVVNSMADRKTEELRSTVERRDDFIALLHNTIDNYKMINAKLSSQLRKIPRWIRRLFGAESRRE